MEFPHFSFQGYKAISAMIGAIVGVGIFGLPYAFAQTGFVIGALELIIFALLFLALLLMFAEVVLQTSGKHRFSGYVKMYLGEKWGHLAMIIFLLTIWGAMIAYLIVGGTFLSTLFQPIFSGPEVFYQIFLAFLVLILTYRGISFFTKMEFYLMSALFFLFLFLVLVSLPHINLENLFALHPEQALVPYGVILFAFGGLGIVPEMKVLLGKKEEHKLPYTVVIGHTLIALLYACFAFVVIGVTGSETTPAAFDGLISVLGPGVAFFGSLLGSLIILSIFSLLALQLQEALRVDYHIPHVFAWFFSIIIPLVLFLLGIRKFIDLIGFMGAVFGGMFAILVLLTYTKMRHSPVCQRHHCFSLPKFFTIILGVLFLSGIILEVIKIIL